MFRLRELERKDIPIINGWRNDPGLIENLGAPFRYINPDVDSAWYDHYMKTRSNSVRCAIVSEESDEIIGLVSLMNIDHLNQCAEFHIMIGSSENQNKGAGTFAVNAMLDHAFRNLNLQRVELSCNVSNTRAQHVYEKAGFVREGLKRRARFKHGSFIDVIQYAILRDEFLTVHNLADWGGALGFCSSWLEKVEGILGIRHVVEICDDAFSSPVFQSRVSERSNYDELVHKWHTSAEIFCIRDAAIKGYVVLYANDRNTRRAFVAMLGVRPEYQRHRCGKALLNACEEFSRWKDMQTIALEVLKANTNAQEFYRHMGFRKESEREHSYIFCKQL